MNDMSEIPPQSTAQSVLQFTDELIDFYEKGQTKYGGRLFRFRVFSIGASVLVTVLSGITAISGHIPWLVTIVAGASTFINTFLVTTKANEYYILSGSQRGKLKGEKLLFLGGGGEYAKETSPEGRLRLLSERVRAIYAEGREGWERINRSDK